jgi:hypothetical protein
MVKEIIEGDERDRNDEKDIDPAVVALTVLAADLPHELPDLLLFLLECVQFRFEFDRVKIFHGILQPSSSLIIGAVWVPSTNYSVI